MVAQISTLNMTDGVAQRMPDTLENYVFPAERLQQTMKDPSKTPLVLIACGSFSPITYLHLRMFEMAADYVKFNNTGFEVIGGWLSPVSDAYKKAGLASAHDRIHMCRIAAAQTSDWVMVDSWESLHTEYTPTAQVLDHFEHEINEVIGGVKLADGTRKQVRVALLAGADLIQTMSTPGVWSDEDLDHILGQYGSFIIERHGTPINQALAKLQHWRHNIYVIDQLIQNDVSSTKIRQFLSRDLSIHYLVPSPVVRYIQERKLYRDSTKVNPTDSTAIEAQN